jgi:hypothetical protein
VLISFSRVGTSKIPPEFRQAAFQAVRIERQEVSGRKCGHAGGKKPDPVARSKAEPEIAAFRGAAACLREINLKRKIERQMDAD